MQYTHLFTFAQNYSNYLKSEQNGFKLTSKHTLKHTLYPKILNMRAGGFPSGMIFHFCPHHFKIDISVSHSTPN